MCARLDWPGHLLRATDGAPARGDATVHGKTGSTANGMRVESADGLAEGVVGGRRLVFAIEGVDEPVAKTGREDGADLVAEGAEGEADEGLAGGGGEGRCGGGVVEEELDLGVHWLVFVITDGDEAGACVLE